MKLVDVHCHLDEYFFKDIEAVIENCKKNNVIAMPAGIDPVTNKHVLALQEKYPDVIFPCLGLYPRDALKQEAGVDGPRLDLDYNPDDVLKFIEKHHKRIAAIGEVGMDHKHGTKLDEQEKDFRKIIELAVRLKKPLIIHSRNAEEKVIQILEEYKFKKIVMHCFCGNHALARKVRENGWYFSIPASVVRDEHFQKIVKETPLSQLLTETDSPFLAPVKNEKNEPTNIIVTIRKIGELKCLADEDIANLIFKNVKYLFEDLNL